VSVLLLALKMVEQGAASYDSNYVYFGVILALIGNTLVACSLNLQKYAHLKIIASGLETSYVRSSVWWLGQIMMVIGTCMPMTFEFTCPVTRQTLSNLNSLSQGNWETLALLHLHPRGLLRHWERGAS
jgi:magnesium transporter NIPA